MPQSIQPRTLVPLDTDSSSVYVELTVSLPKGNINLFWDSTWWRARFRQSSTLRIQVPVHVIGRTRDMSLMCDPTLESIIVEEIIAQNTLSGR